MRQKLHIYAKHTFLVNKQTNKQTRSNKYSSQSDQTYRCSKLIIQWNTWNNKHVGVQFPCWKTHKTTTSTSSVFNHAPPVSATSICHSTLRRGTSRLGGRYHPQKWRFNARAYKSPLVGPFKAGEKKPTIKPLFFGGNTLGRGRLTSHESWRMDTTPEIWDFLTKKERLVSLNQTAFEGQNILVFSGT